MIDPAKLSGTWAVRRLGEADADLVLALCRGNPQFYRYSQAEPTREQVLLDLRITPPGVPLSRKAYVGFFRQERLAAVMDLIDGYPTPEIAFIGFFMVDRALQGRGLGSALIRETEACLRAAGKKTIRLGIDKDNPQSNRFWRKNGFSVVQAAEREGRTILLAEKAL